jgi:hypothetical protein
MLAREQNDNTRAENLDANVQMPLLRPKRDPRPPFDLDTKDSEEDPADEHFRAAHAHHLMDHIMHDIHEGHVTQDKINHWLKEIQTALDHGSLDMDSVNAFMNTLKDTGHYSGENCCLFGK